MQWFSPALLTTKIHSWQRPTESSHTVDFWQKTAGFLCTSLISESVIIARRVGEKGERKRESMCVHLCVCVCGGGGGVRKEHGNWHNRRQKRVMIKCWKRPAWQMQLLESDANCQEWKSKMVNLVSTWHFLPRLDATRGREREREREGRGRGQRLNRTYRWRELRFQ